MGHDLLSYVLLLMGILWLSVLLMWVWPPHPRRTRSHRSLASPSGLKALARPETLFGSHAQAVLCDL